MPDKSRCRHLRRAGALRPGRTLVLRRLAATAWAVARGRSAARGPRLSARSRPARRRLDRRADQLGAVQRGCTGCRCSVRPPLRHARGRAPAAAAASASLLPRRRFGGRAGFGGSASPPPMRASGIVRPTPAGRRAFRCAAAAANGEASPAPKLRGFSLIASNHRIDDVPRRSRDRGLRSAPARAIFPTSGYFGARKRVMLATGLRRSGR